MDSEDKFTGPVNLGNPVELNILELAKKIITLTGSNSKIIYKSLPKDDPRQRQPDIRLAVNNLGWEPNIEIDQGLKRTIKYFS